MSKPADQMTEFSVMTDESEIKITENVLDLKVSNAAFDRVGLVQLTGGAELVPSNVQTFLAVDFYNHDTKNTDMAEGFEPKYNTLFSFKNTSDDFYIKYLEMDTILIDVFYVPKKSRGAAGSPGAIKLGSARLPLRKVLPGRDRDLDWSA